MQETGASYRRWQGILALTDEVQPLGALSSSIQGVYASTILVPFLEVEKGDNHSPDYWWDEHTYKETNGVHISRFDIPFPPIGINPYPSKKTDSDGQGS